MPLENIELRVRQSGNSWSLGVADAGTADENELGHELWDAALPTDLAPSAAVLVAGTATLLIVAAG